MNAVRFLRKRLSQIVLILAWVIFTLLIPGFLPESIIYSFKSSEIDGQLISFKNEAVNQRLVNVGDSFSKGSRYSLGPLVSFTKIYTLIKTKSDAPTLGSGINIQVDYQRALIVMIVLTVATLTGPLRERSPKACLHITYFWSRARRFSGSSTSYGSKKCLVYRAKILWQFVILIGIWSGDGFSGDGSLCIYNNRSRKNRGCLGICLRGASPI